MATAISYDSVHVASGSVFHRLIARLFNAMQARATYKVLNDLTDRQLEDIGLTRAHIKDIARHGA